MDHDMGHSLTARQSEVTNQEHVGTLLVNCSVIIFPKTACKLLCISQVVEKKRQSWVHKKMQITGNIIYVFQ